MWIHHISFLHSWVLYCFHNLDITNNASIHIPVQIFAWTYMDIYLNLFTVMSLRVKLLHHALTSCQTLEKLSHCFLKWLYHFIFHSRVPEFQLLHISFQYISLSLFLIICILVSMKCYLIGVLICSSLMANNFEHILMCFLAICVSFVEKCLFK